jgi:glycosyltransferase involved in cell wall biosynthesis
VNGSTLPLVSAIIIFKDEERFLSEAVQSVFAQTYPHWELLLVDDGSRDASTGMAEEYSRLRPDQVRYLAHPGRANQGMSATRNLGLAHARGEFVAFLDGDDTWLPGKLTRQVELFAANPDAQLVCGATCYWHEWEGGSDHDQIVRTGAIRSGEGIGGCVLEQERLYHPPELMTLLYPLGRGVTPSMSGMMMRRSLLDQVGGFEREFRGLFEDQAFRSKAYLAGPTFVSGECFDRYRQHPASCVQTALDTPVLTNARRRFYRWLHRYLQEVGCTNPAIRRALRQRLIRTHFPRVYRWLVNGRKAMKDRGR